MSCHYAVSIYVKLRTDLPDEWVSAFSQLVDAPKPEEVMFPAIPEMGYEGNDISCLIRFPCFDTMPVYNFGKCHDHTFRGEEHHSYHLTFWNMVLDDVWYHEGFALLQFLAKYSDGNRFAGTMYEACSSIPDLIYIVDGELAFVRGGADGDELDKIRGVSTF